LLNISPEMWKTCNCSNKIIVTNNIHIYKKNMENYFKMNFHKYFSWISNHVQVWSASEVITNSNIF
jgi:hypothetical protein